MIIPSSLKSKGRLRRVFLLVQGQEKYYDRYPQLKIKAHERPDRALSTKLKED